MEPLSGITLKLRALQVLAPASLSPASLLSLPMSGCQMPGVTLTSCLDVSLSHLSHCLALLLPCIPLHV
eukprot:952911-Rhodomonas_salina.1